MLPLPARQLATGTILVNEPEGEKGGVAIYARVSSDQRCDLDGQVARLVTHRTTARVEPARGGLAAHPALAHSDSSCPSS